MHTMQPGKDVDVDLPERALLHLSGSARYEWGHGIRLGVTKHQARAACLHLNRSPSVCIIYV